MADFNSVAVIGAGAYGTALADVAARAGREVVLYARSAAAAELMQTSRNNPRLPGAAIDDAVFVTADLVAGGARRYHPARRAVAAIARGADGARAAAADGMPVVACAKGIEHGTHKFMTEVIADVAPNAMPAILSGPNFADDVAAGLPTAVTLACADEDVAIELVQALGSATFRPYHSTDVRGVEIGGAAKNVLAIAAGIVVGKRARRIGAGGADHARLQRIAAARPRLRRARRDDRRACPASAI